MAKSTWIQLSSQVPTDGQLVWVRLINESLTPFQANYVDSEFTFVNVVTEREYPAYMIASWRNIT
jgi:hypothetical protein